MKALSALEAAVEADPNYALAWALLSEHYLDEQAHVFNKLDYPLKKGLDCALHAISIDPNCQHG